MKQSNKISVIIAFSVGVIGALLYWYVGGSSASSEDMKVEIAKSIFKGDIEKFDAIVSEYPDLKYSNFTFKLNKNLAHYLGFKKSKSIFVKKLLDLGVDINAQDDDGRTPLHHAIDGRNPATAKALLENGASLAIENSAGLSPIGFCEQVIEDFPNNKACKVVFQFRYK